MSQRFEGTLLAVAFVTALCGAADLQEIPLRGVGFIGPTPGTNPPETSGCGNFKYTLSVGFPYRNRSLVIDLGTPQAVHALRLFDDYSDNGGTSPVMTGCGLRLYTSNDDRTYRPYQPAFTVTARSGKPDGCFDVVEIGGLAIVARYIKLHADLADERWDFGNNNLQKMARAYRDPDRAAAIGSLWVARYAETHLPVRAHCQRPKVADGPLMLTFLVDGAMVGRLPVDEAGRVDGAVDIGRLPLGPQVLEVRLMGKDLPLALAAARSFRCSRVVHSPGAGAAGDAVPGQVTLLDDLGVRTPQLPTGWSLSTFRPDGAGEPQPLLVASAGAAELALALPGQGARAVSVGLVGGDTEAEARLPGAATPRRCRLEVWRDYERAAGLGESFAGWTGGDGAPAVLTLKPVPGKPCRVAFVRLLQMSPEQVQLARAATETPDRTPRVIVNNDGFSLFFGGIDTREKLERMIDAYAGRPLHAYDWCLGSDASCTYATKVGTVFGANVKEFWRKGDKLAHDCVQGLIDRGDDPLRVVIDRCRQKRIPVNASFRMNADYPDPEGRTFNGALYWKNIECRIATREGKRLTNLSYAFPEVRAFRLAIIREAAGYGPDGFHLDFLRHPPFVGFDKPLLDAYQAKHGADPLQTPDDPRWRALGTEVMTGFVRDVRQALDEVGQALGRRLSVSASFDCLNYAAQGLDVATWVREGLVDEISPGAHGLGGTYFPVKEFAAMTHGTTCRLCPRLEHIIAGHDPTPESERGEVRYESERMTLNLYRARALELYAEGGVGVYLFNTGGQGLLEPLSDISGLRAWDVFERPLIGWFEPATP